MYKNSTIDIIQQKLLLKRRRACYAGDKLIIHKRRCLCKRGTFTEDEMLCYRKDSPKLKNEGIFIESGDRKSST
jgi:hypothetical protein